MPDSLLSIQNLTISFPSYEGTFRAVKNVSLDVEKGRSLGIVGESGSGKSLTALSVLNLLPVAARVETGTITYRQDHKRKTDLLRTSSHNMRNIRGKEISMIFQEPMTSLNPVYTCGNQVMEVMLKHLSLTRNEARERAKQLFSEVELPQPSRILRSYPHELSGGQRQRIMIAMAIACDPRLLIADEPTTALDVTIQRSILRLLEKLKERYGMSMIFISHDLAVVSQVADEMAVMYNGMIVEKGSRQRIIHRPSHSYTRGLIACKPPLDRKPERLHTLADFTGTNQIKMAGKNLQPEIISSRPSSADQSPDKVFVLRDVTKLFALRTNFFGKPLEQLRAIDRVSLTIFKNETLGLVGESGSGKSTLARILLKLLDYNKGDIRFYGQNLSTFGRKDLKQYRQRVQIIFQDPYSSLNPRLTVGKMITEPMQYYDYYSNRAKRKEKAMQLLNDVHLSENYYHRYPHELSGGQRQRVAIARVLALNPEFIICDEAVSALDVSIQAEVLNLLQDLKKRYRLTFIFITHDFSVVRFISDRVAVMKDGAVVETGATNRVFDAPAHEYTRKLLASIPAL